MLLLADDDATGRQVAAYNLRRAGFEVDEAADGALAIATFDPSRHTVVVTDLRMPRGDGMAVLDAVHARAPDVPVIVVTAHGNVDAAVSAMKHGAWDFLEKPFSRDRLEATVRRAAEVASLRVDNRRLRSSVERPILTRSPVMEAALSVADRVAMTDAAVLVRGESGTGKELVARRIHARSRRAAAPFVPVNCAAIPGELLESEMFGHARGAFTGAAKAREGRFRRAHGGTLFLDEVAELSPELQAKLLRVLEDGHVDVLGADEPVTVDVRILSATNQDLTARVAEGRFREDLYWRLAAIEVRLPPLRERPADIEPLARTFLDDLANGRDLDLPDAVVKALERRRWPGNVRELRNACERLAALCPGDAVRVDDLPPERPSTTSDAWLDRLPGGFSLVDLELQVVAHVLRREDGNLSRAARALGIPRHVLAYKVQKHGLRRDA
ncbi:MAG: sigma-54-dependent transcriptional regulator [Myxococcota bacterium]